MESGLRDNGGDDDDDDDDGGGDDDASQAMVCIAAKNAGDSLWGCPRLHNNTLLMLLLLPLLLLLMLLPLFLILSNVPVGYELRGTCCRNDTKV